MPKQNPREQTRSGRSIAAKPNVCALAVMTKAPQAGNSKTRLSPPLTTAEAATLSACFLRDTCENIAGISLDGTADGIAVYTPVGAEELIDGLLPDSFAMLGQRGTSFGERLFHTAEDLISLGYNSLCLIDSDSPTLPSEFLRAAVAALASPGDRVVLGPALDGGYYLIGLKHAHRHLFADIDWSTPKVFRQTIARAKENNLPVTILPPWFDVDDAATLRQLCDEIFGKAAIESGAAPYEAPHTRAYLSRLLDVDVVRQRLWTPLAAFAQSAWSRMEDAT
jgi:uncharacterized protein